MATKRKKPTAAPPEPPPLDHAQQEAEEARRAASSPLSLHFELVGCEFAQPTLHTDRLIPPLVFRPPCPFGKTTTDQDCRMCHHHRIMRVGAGRLDGDVRYPHHGVTVPLTEDQALRILDLLAAEGTGPLRRPHWHKHTEEQEAIRLAAEARHAAARALEQQSPFARRTE